MRVTSQNPYTGEIYIDLAGEARLVRYGWPQLALLRDQLGEDFDVKIDTAFRQMDLPTIALALAAGIAGDPVTPNDIMRLSPPLLPAFKIIRQALFYSFNGPEGATARPAANPRKRAIARWIGSLTRSRSR